MPFGFLVLAKHTSDFCDIACLLRDIKWLNDSREEFDELFKEESNSKNGVTVITSV